MVKAVFSQALAVSTLNIGLHIIMNSANASQNILTQDERRMHTSIQRVESGARGQMS